MKKTKKTKKSLNNQIKIIDKTQKKLYNNNTFGDMAQLVERLVRNEEASGSNPLISTTKKTATAVFFFYDGDKFRYSIPYDIAIFQS